MNRFMTPEVRTWIYSIALAVLSLLGIYGVLEEGQIERWAQLAAAILGVIASGTAVAYRPTRKPHPDPGLGEGTEAEAEPEWGGPDDIH